MKNTFETTALDENTDHLLSVEDLAVRFDTGDERVHAVNGVDFELSRGETLGIVGESGSGKSVTALSILGLLEETATVTGAVQYKGADLLSLSDAELRDLRGNQISMVFQDPGSSLNPVLTTGDQVSETIRTHEAPGGEEISWLEQSVLGNLFRSRDSFTKFEESWEQTVELFERVGIPLPEQRALEYPHEFSGGMKQRALIAIAIACKPDILICDEPTTALDVTIEAQILELIDELQKEFGTAVLFITHDMGVVRKICDRTAVMYAGNIVERAQTDELFDAPKHPYTKALLKSVPRLDSAAELDPVPGRVPDLTTPPSGCPFAERCSSVNDACRTEFPQPYPVSTDSDPLRITHEGSKSVTNPPEPRSIEATDHHVNCVLYGDAPFLTAEHVPGEEGDDA